MSDVFRADLKLSPVPSLSALKFYPRKQHNSQARKPAQSPPGGNIMNNKEPDMNIISDKFKKRKGAGKNRNGDESSHEEERQKKKEMIEKVSKVW